MLVTPRTGRPRTGRAREKVLPLRLSDDEDAEVRAAAEREGWPTPSEWIRDVVLARARGKRLPRRR